MCALVFILGGVPLWVPGAYLSMPWMIFHFGGTSMCALDEFILLVPLDDSSILEHLNVCSGIYSWGGASMGARSILIYALDDISFWRHLNVCSGIYSWRHLQVPICILINARVVLYHFGGTSMCLLGRLITALDYILFFWEHLNVCSGIYSLGAPHDVLI
jgi:hypothetical protein